ncbi:uncharacterized protein [Asterias amurensis]
MWHQLTSAIMSDVLIQLCLKSAIVLIATTCIPVLLGAPITSLTTSLPEVQQPSTPLDIATCGKNSYWDIELAQCKPCVTCPMGMGSTVSECGYGNGEIGRCEECDDGYYQDQTVTKGPCNRCSSCDSNRIVLSDCTKTTNTECGPCKEGYGQQPNHPDLCSACYLFNDDEKPPECLTLTPTPGLASVTDTDECLPGYVYRLNKCVDINECDVPYSCDSSVSRCSNTDGSFTCQCLPGFEMNSSGECVDTDECALNQDTCNTSVSTCHNTKGSYRCECLPGYVMDRLNECVDTDECAQNQDTCNTSVSTCHNTKGSYRCECLPGYVMDRLNECVDINECDVPYSCDSSVSRCSNTDGSFTCQCLPGFEMNSSGECVDTDECAQNQDTCNTSVSTCHNTKGSYRCECLPGYVMNRLHECVDINECDVPYSCDSSVSRCSNTDGSFTCHCLPGFEMSSSGECVDTDECAQNQDTCNTSVSTCHNTKGSYRCECLQGYVMDRLNECVDTDECAQNQDTCNTSVSTCHNTKGSYRCECLPGYVMDRLNECVDINECDLPYSCDSSISRCSNTDGSFTCQCLPGVEINSSGECVGKNVVVIGVPLGIIVGLVVLLVVLVAIWLWRKKCKGKKVFKTSALTASGSGDNATSGASVSLQAVTNSNRPSLTTAEAQRSGASEAVKDEGEPLLLEETSPRGNISNHPPDTLGDADLIDADESAPAISHTQTQGDEESDEVVEPNTDADDNSCPLSTEVSTQRDEDGDMPGPMDQIGGNILNHPPDTLGDDDGDEVENADLIDADESASAIGHTQTQGDEESDEVVEPNIDADDYSFPLSTEVSTQRDEARDIPGPMDQIGGEGRRSTPVRPSFNRSQSVPGTSSTINENSRKEGKAPHILPENTQKRLVEMGDQDRKEKFMKDFQKASRLGKDLQWHKFNLKFRNKVNQLMKTDNKEKNFKVFGELMGLNRNTELKDCSDLNSVFTQLEMSLDAEVFMDKVLQTLKDMKRNDVVREIMKEINDRKPTCDG